MKITCTKMFGPFPAAHRQPKHDGHCRLIHGHDWRFEITFYRKSGILDENNFVIDFGKLGEIKKELACLFDHTMVINHADPEANLFRELERKGLCKLVLVPSASAEGLAEYVFNVVNRLVLTFTEQKVGVCKVKCFEDEKNYATYRLFIV